MSVGCSQDTSLLPNLVRKHVAECQWPGKVGRGAITVVLQVVTYTMFPPPQLTFGIAAA